MRSFAIISFLVATAVAQQQTVVSTSPFIPSGISDGCKTALQGFDTDTTLQSCTSSIISATSGYGPGSKPATAATMKTSLDNMCSSTSCSEATVRTILAQFYQSCQAELTSNPNKDVIALYEVFYTLSPFKTAVCSKDDAGSYCALQIPSRVGNSASGTNTNLVVTGGVSPANAGSFLSTTVLSRRADAPTTSTTFKGVNATTFANTNILFLFLSASLNATTLCVPCTRSIMTSYINFESDVPMAIAKSSSQLLSGQTALYNGIQSECGASFLGGAVQAAGGLGNNGVSGKLSGGSPASVSVGQSLTLGLGVVTLMVASFL